MANQIFDVKMHCVSPRIVQMLVVRIYYVAQYCCHLKCSDAGPDDNYLERLHVVVIFNIGVSIINNLVDRRFL